MGFDCTQMYYEFTSNLIIFLSLLAYLSIDEILYQNFLLFFCIISEIWSLMKQTCDAHWKMRDALNLMQRCPLCHNLVKQ